MKVSILVFFLSTAQISIIAQEYWALQASGATENINTVTAVDSNIVWVAGRNGVIFNTVNGGDTWTLKRLESEGINIYGMDAYNESLAWIVTYKSSDSETALYKTTDGGDSWVLKHSSDKPEAWYNDVKFYDENNGIFYGDAEDGYFAVYTTEDGGENWERVVSPETLAPTSSAEYGVVNNMEITGNSAWFGTQNELEPDTRIFYSTDKGKSWNFTSLAEKVKHSVNSISFYDESIGVFIGEWEFGKTYDGGLSWNITDSPAVNNGGVSLVTSTSIVLVSSYYGGDYFPAANLSTDGGENWRSIATEISDHLNDVDFINPSTGWAVGNNGVILKWIGGELPDNPTFVNDNNIISREYSLTQNFPNPFNPVTKIRYSVPVGDYISLKVFDLLGNEITTLVDEYKNAGEYEIEFNAKYLSSGLYFYQMSTGDIRITKKLIKLK